MSHSQTNQNYLTVINDLLAKSDYEESGRTLHFLIGVIESCMDQGDETISIEKLLRYIQKGLDLQARIGHDKEKKA